MRAAGDAREGALRRLVTEQVAAWRGTAAGDVPMDRPLADLGMSSRDAVVLAGELSRAVGRELPATLLWEAPTGDALVARLCGMDDGPTGIAPPPPPPPPGEPIAVIGIGCRLPGGVHGPDDYWRLLSEGTDAIRRVPEDRWRDFTAFPPADAPPYGGYLDDIAGFDADFFRITPREAAVMDPQQRILLEVVHEALDHAAVPAASLAATATGVFVGVSAPEYGQLTGADPAAVDPWAPAGGALSVAAGRLSYVLDARGPSMAVDTACSSSLVAVHHACVSLRTGESDTAIAAGVNLLLSPTVTVAFRRAGALAPDGRCKPFSAAADGIGRGEGCAAVLLKRLSDAERDGDRVLAVIRATAVNSDGRSNGLLAPNPAAQRALLATAYARAGLAPAHIDHVEAHGTGTPLGDPIEAGALGAVLGAGRDPDQPLLLGSVKGNLGHLESAAGIAGLVKTVLALHHDVIPTSLHCAEGTALDDERLRVVTEPEPWPRYGGTATAGVSGFGFGGTNAHAVLEEWRPAPGRTGALLDQPALAEAHPGGGTARTASGGGSPWASGPDLADPARLGEHAALVPPRRIGAAPGQPVDPAERGERAPAPPRPVGAAPGQPAETGETGEHSRPDTAHTEPGSAPPQTSTPGGAHAAGVGGRAAAPPGCVGVAPGEPTEVGDGPARTSPTTAREAAPTGGSTPNAAVSAGVSEHATPPPRRIDATPREPANAGEHPRKGTSRTPSRGAPPGASTRDAADPAGLGGHATAPLPPEGTARLYLLSDVDTARLRDTADRIAAWLRAPEGSAACLADVARTLAGRAGRGAVRAAVVARDRDELADALSALGAERPDARVVSDDRDVAAGRGPVWVFSGYGSQWSGMGRRLLAEEPAFAAAVEKLDAQLAPECGMSLYDHLASGGDLDRLEVAQPVLFGLQVALAELWRSYGVEPAAVVGHSMGEVAAAVCAGALEVADAARVVAVRARLLSGLRGGAMAVVDVEDDELGALARDFPGVHVAVHSSPSQKVVTGDEPAVARLVRRLQREGRVARAMRVVGAGHSPQVEPLLAELTQELAGVRGTPPRVPVYSTVLDDPRGDCVFDAAHWAANLRRPVRLDRAVAAAAADGHSAFVEISPHPVLTRALADTAPGALAVGTLRRDADGSAGFLAQVGALYAAGLRLPPPPGRVIDLPAPRWRHVRHWWTDGRTGAVAAADVPAAPVTEVRAGMAPGTATHAGAAHPGTAPVDTSHAAEDTSITARLCHHIAAVTGHPPARVTPATALAQLGLDSLMAVRIRTALEREFAIELPLRDLLGAATVAEAAARIERALPARDASLRVLQATGSRPPFFLVHAAGGTTDVYRALTERLGGEQPVYGLERVEEARTVAEKARRYADSVAAVHPDGPCLLGGWSFGGFVAQETARQLTAAGRDVALVALIDSVRPLPQPGRTPADRIRAHFTGFARHVADTYGVQLNLLYDKLTAMDDDGERIDTVLRALREAADVPPAALEHQRSSYLDLRIGEAHRPGRHDGPVVLYRACEPAPHTVRDPAYEREDDALGWDEVCPRLTVVPVAGHHLSLLDPPCVDEIAAHLRRLLAEDNRRT
ncbi:beta-ketoacyl synthase N-terminal-like domain-containing protein [Streptomyces sp. NPDC059850]|uniref:beta-ketoacyl synthase N-terminal-like domain-containing protein n=1 Tax=Streptomyces sp. NPDC059850 TaxID=3346970 RepID=UPI003661D5BE